tara:strand:- start:227 stop:406 length:180 start_codon:yes stop_codon:yes gene_type:complete
MDRIPILVAIATIYFGFRVTNWLTALAFFFAIAGPLVVNDAPTAGNRGGVELFIESLFS